MSKSTATYILSPNSDIPTDSDIVVLGRLIEDPQNPLSKIADRLVQVCHLVIPSKAGASGPPPLSCSLPCTHKSTPLSLRRPLWGDACCRLLAVSSIHSLETGSPSIRSSICLLYLLFCLLLRLPPPSTLLFNPPSTSSVSSSIHSSVYPSVCLPSLPPPAFSSIFLLCAICIIYLLPCLLHYLLL